LTADIVPFSPRRRTGPRVQTERSKIEPLTTFDAMFYYYFAEARQDAALTWRQKRLLMELTVLAADASGRPLGYSIAELALAWGWEPAEVRADAEVCARLKYLDLSADVMLLRDPRDRARRSRKAA